jgi:hypothetical protein
MKKRYFLIPVALLCAPLLMTLYISANYGYDFKESWEVLKAVGKSDTKFQALKFEERNFRKITPGMTGRDVFELVGLPLERHNNDAKWSYSVPVSGAEYYHERTVLMDKGVVTQVICRFHKPEAPYVSLPPSN